MYTRLLLSMLMTRCGNEFPKQELAASTARQSKVLLELVTFALFHKAPFARKYYHWRPWGILHASLSFCIFLALVPSYNR